MCNNNGEKEKGEKSKTSNEKSWKRKLFKYARLLVGFAFNSFSFWASSLSLSFSPFLFQNFLSLVLGNCSKTNCKLRTNWLTEPKAAIKSVG